jgi:probable HAF family extracellular repeat protein
LIVEGSPLSVVKHTACHLALVSVIGLGVRPVCAQCQYEVTAIIQAPCGPDGFSPTIGQSINEHGDIAGYIIACPPGPELPFIWSEEEGLQLIELPQGAARAWAWDINDHGEVVGTVDIQGLDGYFRSAQDLIVLPPPGSRGWNQASAVNNHSVVVGERSIGDNLAPLNGYMWSQETGFTDLGLLGGPNTGATDINDDGVIIGWIGHGQSDALGFVWDDGAVTELGPIPGGMTSYPVAINSDGVVVGSGRIPWKGGSGHARAFLWSQGQMRFLDTLPGFEYGHAYDVNDVGFVVGVAWGVNGNPNISRAFVWQDGQMSNLNDLIDPGLGTLFTDANGVNNSGVIVARSGTITYLLTPVDRPSADIDGDCDVDRADLDFAIRDWGTDRQRSDINTDGTVDALDWLAVLAGWTGN